MRDGDPFPTEFIGNFDRIAKLGVQVFQIGSGQLIHRGIFADHLMRLPFKQGKICLTLNGRVGVIHLAEEQITPHGFIRFVLEQFIHQHHLGKG